MNISSGRELKDSGIHWIGQIPTAWQVGKFRHIFTESKEINGKNPVGEMLSVSGYRGVEIKEYSSDSLKRDQEDLETYRVVRPGQLAVNTMWLNYAGLGVSELIGHVSPAYRSYWIDQKLNPRFAHHLMRSQIYVNAYTGYLTGVRPNSLQMSRENLMNWPVLIPEMGEQVAIAEFLDRETAQIDALIEKQNQLVETLNAKRNAIIIRAVTRGVLKNPRLRATGLEWLPQVPADWTQQPFFTVGVEIKNKNKGLIETNLLSLSYGEIVNRDIDSNDGLLPESFDGYQIIQPQDLVFRFTDLQNDQKSLRTAISKSKGIITSAYLAVRVTSQNPEFIAFLMRGYDLLKVFYAMGGGLRQSMKFDDIRRLPLFFPSLHEQENIVEFLTKSTIEIDLLKAKASEMVQLLQERRQALISAAVTGKIDVRGKQ